MMMTRVLGRVAVGLALLCGGAGSAAAQSWTVPRTWSTGELVTSSIMNSAIRDNELILRAGGIAVTSQAIGDLLCASSATQVARLADVATGQVLKSGGVGACPTYGTIAVSFLSDGSNVALLNAANAFTGSGTSSFIGGGASQQLLIVQNTSAGASNFTSLYVGNNSINNLTALSSFSSTWTPSGQYLASGSALDASGAGGLSLAATHASGVIRFYAGGTTEAMRIHASRGISIGDTTDPGATNLRVAGASTLVGLSTFSGFGTNSFSAGGTGGNILAVRNTTAGTTNYATVYVGNDASTNLVLLAALSSTYTPSAQYLASGGALDANGAGGLSLAATHASGAIRFYTGGTAIRWGINAAGDWTFGTSSIIAESNGTPTSTGGGSNNTIAGRDGTFRVTIGASPDNTNIVVTFGHTWTNIPVCLAQYNNGSSYTLQYTVTTTTLTLDKTSIPVGSWTGYVDVICRGR